MAVASPGVLRQFRELLAQHGHELTPDAAAKLMATLPQIPERLPDRPETVRVQLYRKRSGGLVHWIMSFPDEFFLSPGEVVRAKIDDPADGQVFDAALTYAPAEWYVAHAVGVDG